MKNTFKYDIEKYIRSQEGQKELKEKREELVRMMDDPKAPKTLKRTIRFIDFLRLDK